MKKIFTLLLGITLPIISAYAEQDSESYDIVGIYERVELPNGSKVLNSYSLKDIDYVFVPKTLSTGRYEVELSREDSNFYKVCGTDIYIETRYCYEYGYYIDAIMVIDSIYGYDKGDIIFLE